MNDTTIEQQAEIECYLRLGDYDARFALWPGDTLITQHQTGSHALKQALIEAIEARVRGLPIAMPVLHSDPVSFTRGKIEPMVRGLFPYAEQEQVLAVLERSVVFLTPETIRQALEEMPWLHSAWAMANLYLGSVGAELLSAEAPQLVGMSIETTCFVSMEYFGQTPRFSDYIVHEAAHVFHNCRRRTAGLRETRRRQWLLELEFRKRETFACCCEAYSRILELASRFQDRSRLADELAGGGLPDDGSIDLVECVDILSEAAAARNGWKRILARCAPAASARAPASAQ